MGNFSMKITKTQSTKTINIYPTIYLLMETNPRKRSIFTQQYISWWKQIHENDQYLPNNISLDGNKSTKTINIYPTIYLLMETNPRKRSIFTQQYISWWKQIHENDQYLPNNISLDGNKSTKTINIYPTIYPLMGNQCTKAINIYLTIYLLMETNPRKRSIFTQQYISWWKPMYENDQYLPNNISFDGKPIHENDQYLPNNISLDGNQCTKTINIYLTIYLLMGNQSTKTINIYPTIYLLMGNQSTKTINIYPTIYLLMETNPRKRSIFTQQYIFWWEINQRKRSIFTQQYISWWKQIHENDQYLPNNISFDGKSIHENN